MIWYHRLQLTNNFRLRRNCIGNMHFLLNSEWTKNDPVFFLSKIAFGGVYCIGDSSDRPRPCNTQSCPIGNPYFILFVVFSPCFWNYNIHNVKH